MQPTKDSQKPGICPKCGATVTFKENDGDIECWNCPNCGKINLKREQWKKKLLTQPTILPDVHVNCNFCKNKHSEKCTDTPNPDTCSMYDENKNISNSDKILLLIDAESPQFFKDQYEQFWVYFKDGRIQKTLTLHGPDFRRICTDLFFRNFGKVPRNDNIKEAINAFEAIARNSENLHLKTRITMLKKKSGIEIWVDLGNKFYQSVKITKEGYQIQDITPPLFRRYSHMLPLPHSKQFDGKDAKDGNNSKSYSPPSTSLHFEKEEEGGGEKYCRTPSIASLASYPTLFRIFEFLRVKEEDKILIISTLVSYFFDKYPYVCIYLHGSSGKGKSVGSKCIKKLIDPSTTIILELPKKREQLLQDVSHHYCCVFDNVSYISSEYSDVLCRVLTGYGVSKRKLYTDDEDFYRQLKRPVWLNGISIEITREDLLKRTILCEALPIIGKERTEEDIFSEFEAIQPYMLHDLYSLVSKVLQKLPEIKPPKLFRMADYTKIGCAVAEALGYNQQFFIDAYETKLNEQVKELIWNNTVGSVLYDWLQNQAEWRGTPTDLFKLIKNHAKEEMGISTRARDFPKSPPHLTRKINLLLEPFQKIGIELNHIDGLIREWHIINHNFEDGHEEATELSKLEALKNWIHSEHAMIGSDELKEKIAELNFVEPPEHIIQQLFDDGDLSAENYIENLRF